MVNGFEQPEISERTRFPVQPLWKSQTESTAEQIAYSIRETVGEHDSKNKNGEPKLAFV